jgi:hypothetical protein
MTQDIRFRIFNTKRRNFQWYFDDNSSATQAALIGRNEQLTSFNNILDLDSYNPSLYIIVPALQKLGTRFFSLQNW